MKYEEMTQKELIELIQSMDILVDNARLTLERLNLYAAIIEETRESVAVQDINGKYIFVNRSYEQLRGYTKEELLSKDFHDNYPPDELSRREKAFEEILETGYWRGELSFINKKGTVVPTLCTTVLLRDKQGEPQCVVGLMTDMTDNKKFERQLLEAKLEAEKANRAKSHFLANMSHEIRTPMNALIGFTDILLQDETDRAKINILEVMKKSGNILLELINGILDLSKIEAGKHDLLYRPFNIVNTLKSIKEMFNSMAREKGLTYLIKLPEEMPSSVLGDERSLKQVLLNILGNAFKFTEKGSITITVQYSDGLVSFSIADTGIGIEKEKQEDIFTAFKQAHDTISNGFGGTGLGLAISRQLIQLMGGSITVESVPGSGSVFSVTIPMPEAVEEYDESRPGMPGSETRDTLPVPPPESSSTKTETIYDLKILVAEDNEINQRVLRMMIEKLGFRCDMAGNGKIALEMLADKDYDVLLLDMQMPVMGGEEALVRIRRNEAMKGIHVIAQTAYAMKGDEERFILNGCDDYISKPIDKKILENKLLRLMHSRN